MIPNPLEDVRYSGITDDFVRKFDFFVLRDNSVPVSLFITTAGRVEQLEVFAVEKRKINKILTYRFNRLRMSSVMISPSAVERKSR